MTVDTSYLRSRIAYELAVPLSQVNVTVTNNESTAAYVITAHLRLNGQRYGATRQVAAENFAEHTFPSVCLRQTALQLTQLLRDEAGISQSPTPPAPVIQHQHVTYTHSWGSSYLQTWPEIADETMHAYGRSSPKMPRPGDLVRDTTGRVVGTWDASGAIKPVAPVVTEAIEIYERDGVPIDSSTARRAIDLSGELKR